jgi:hypothetical protein
MKTVVFGSSQEKEVPDAGAIRRISKNGANRTIQQN